MKKGIYILVIGTAILAVVAYFALNRAGERIISPVERELYLKLDSSTVDKIEIANRNGAWTVERNKDGWFLTKPVTAPADSDFIAASIGLLANMRVKTVVSSNPEKRSLFLVDSSGAIVSVYQNGEFLAKLFIGKPGAVYNETYIREENSDDVVIVAGTLFFAFTAPMTNWRDGTVVNVPKDSIIAVVVKHNNSEYSLRFADSLWFLDGLKANQKAVDLYLANLAYIPADDFVDTTLKEQPQVIASLNYFNNQALLAPHQDGERYYIRRANSEIWFIISKNRAEALLPKRADLLKTQD